MNENELLALVTKNGRIPSSLAYELLADIDKYPLELLIRIADSIRQINVGNIVYYSTTFFLYPTNLCELSCSFCSFYAKPSWESAWFHTPQALADQLRRHMSTIANQKEQICEVHIVGGLWKECDLSYYKTLFTLIKEIDSNIHIKALTGIEIDFLAKLHNLPVPTVIQELVSCGLGSMPGGGAELLVESVRKKIAPQKISSEEYLEIHRQAHQLNISSNITMLCGHIEKDHDIITHLLRVRSAQDETGKFNTFIPLKYHIENNALGRKVKSIEDEKLLRIYALSRIVLDNIPNIKVLWNYTGIDFALKALKAGANDLGSTATQEKVITMAGGIKVNMNGNDMEFLIKEIGRIPKKTHSGHSYEEDWPKSSFLMKKELV